MTILFWNNRRYVLLNELKSKRNVFSPDDGKILYFQIYVSTKVVVETIVYLLKWHKIPTRSFRLNTMLYYPNVASKQQSTLH